MRLRSPPPHPPTPGPPSILFLNYGFMLPSCFLHSASFLVPSHYIRIYIYIFCAAQMSCSPRLTLLSYATGHK